MQISDLCDTSFATVVVSSVLSLWALSLYISCLSLVLGFSLALSLSLSLPCRAAPSPLCVWLLLKQIRGIVPGPGGCQNFVCVLIFGSFLMGRKTHKQSPPQNPGTIP